MRTNYTITPHISDGDLFVMGIDASDVATLFNLSTLDHIEARPELDGYHKDSKHRIRVSHVRDLGNDRRIHDTIGWLKKFN